MEQYFLKLPSQVYAGIDSIQNLSNILKDNNVKKVAFFTDKGIIATGMADVVIEEIKKSTADYHIISDIPSEPDYSAVQNMAEDFKSKQCDFIVALGGGSVLDTAKLTSVLNTDEYTIKDLLDTPQIAKKTIKTLMIPTTAGTGSESTPNGIVAVPEKNVKIGIVNQNMIVDYVILDPFTIKRLPKKIIAATGVDALAHAIECFTSKKANQFSDFFALESLDIILNNLVTIYDNEEALEEKSKMLIASFYAGVAICSSGTTLVHALSYPLGGKYHIPHGISNAMLLAPVMKFNEPVVKERFALAYDRCVHTEKTCTTIEEKSAFILKWLNDIVEHLEIPTSLMEYGVPKEDLEELVSLGMKVERLLVNNMKDVTADDARAIYSQLL